MLSCMSSVPVPLERFYLLCIPCCHCGLCRCAGCQAFEKEAEVERREIGQRAVRNLERRTNQLLRIWSIARIARYERRIMAAISRLMSCAVMIFAVCGALLAGVVTALFCVQ